MHGKTGTFCSLKTLSAVLLSILLGAAMVLAQPADNRDRPESAEAPRETADATTGDNDETAAGDTGVVLSPFDYEASESISEDASVSFPVDI